MNLKKILVLALLVACAIAFFAFDLGRYFSLAYLKQSQDGFHQIYQQRPVLVTLVFFAVYVLVTALSLPGATILTLAAGVGFGLVWGTIVASLASTIGATLAMLAARTVLRDTMRHSLTNSSRVLPWLGIRLANSVQRPSFPGRRQVEPPQWAIRSAPETATSYLSFATVIIASAN